MATRIAVSLAKHFAMAAIGASSMPDAPLSTTAAERYTSWRAASVCIAMSASIQRMPWFSLTLRPQVTRFFTNSMLWSMAPCARPTPRAPISGRLLLKASITSLKPRPSSPMRLASATNTSSRNSGHEGTPRAPILSSWRPTVKPLLPRSTMNRLMARAPSSSPVLAATSTKSAMCELVHQIFEPLMR